MVPEAGSKGIQTMTSFYETDALSAVPRRLLTVTSFNMCVPLLQGV